MDNKISEAIRLLNENGYVVTKVTENMKKYFNECVKSNGGDCGDCPCNICIMTQLVHTTITK